ncbi:2'-5' RNA ligase family protein [Vibrio mangrovi]|uniref:2',5' RNA ligase family n=1 Tax=Vibrio mangrovi TaxID=474394 RepID=A0A1Y6IYB2_9VIBR|nr:hypothetical protein [Vibrio mangrovi]MDW6005153.1 hypothetical protein [Vibrio mangrovi]SMS02637.1 hypothetical protein VIM7927_03971 [Vibrio mangrovi]
MGEEKRIYDTMWRNFEQVVKTGQYQTDPLIDNPHDSRRGMTTLSYLRNSTSLVNEISNFLQKIKSLEPEQYYQPLSDLHLTILTIITCFENYHLSESEGQDYAEIFKEAVRGIGSFDIQFKGITASPSCILLQGFMPDEMLSDLREKLRAAFGQSHLHASRDSRYNIATAHSTVVRFKAPLRDPDMLFRFLKDYREFDFGIHTVNRVELVFNDWYLKDAHTKQLAEVSLFPACS